MASYVTTLPGVKKAAGLSTHGDFGPRIWATDEIRRDLATMLTIKPDVQRSCTYSFIFGALTFFSATVVGRKVS